jgi:S1-C subfamily serine protease
MGYPGERGATGHSVYKKTRVTALRGPAGEEKWIQLANVAAQGNSGGPVLDVSGNVVAVMSGMALTYRADAHGNPIGAVLTQTDVAVTEGALKDFLDEHAIPFSEARSGLMAYDDQALRTNAHRYTVPVRCIQDADRSV